MRDKTATTRPFGRHKRALDASRRRPPLCTWYSTTHEMSDVHMELDKVDQAGNNTPPPPEPEDKPSGSNRSKSKTTAGLVRETGKSLLPISRVQKIIKADKVRSLVLAHRMQGIIIDVVSGVTHCCKGGRVSHIISNGRVYQEVIGG